MQEFDYIICGGGTAGCVVATRLIEENKGSVLVLEAGKKDDGFFFKIPAGIPVVIEETWDYTTEPDPKTNNRRMSCAQGRVLGGSSSVNGMIYLRGHAQDYDDWAETYGCEGWEYKNLLPYFIKSENNESLSGPDHGNSGHFVISDTRMKHPLTRAFIKAGQELGLPYVVDFNDEAKSAIGFYQHNIRNGERGSTSRVYLGSVINNTSLTVKTHAQVKKIDVENGHATTVQCEINGITQSFKARKSIVLSAGSIGSAKTLLLSGIGPKDHLEDLGIPVVADLPVGKNYQDHLHVSVNATIKEPISLYGEDKGIKKYKHGLQWLLYRQGIVASSFLEGGAFMDMDGDGRPDVQAMFIPVLDTFDDPENLAQNRTHGLSIKMCHLRPKSRGELKLRSADPNASVLINGNLLDHPDDVKGLIQATQFGMDLLAQPSMKAIIEEVFSPNAKLDRNNWKGLENFVRETCKTTYHPVGTCRMGKNPKDSVVDTSLRVHGIDGLRIIDCSVFPALPSANTNGPTVALAEKAVDLLIAQT